MSGPATQKQAHEFFIVGFAVLNPQEKAVFLIISNELGWSRPAARTVKVPFPFYLHQAPPPEHETGRISGPPFWDP
jgi:hypothetical protein